MYRNL